MLSGLHAAMGALPLLQPSLLDWLQPTHLSTSHQQEALMQTSNFLQNSDDHLVRAFELDLWRVLHAVSHDAEMDYCFIPVRQGTERWYATASPLRLSHEWHAQRIASRTSRLSHATRRSETCFAGGYLPAFTPSYQVERLSVVSLSTSSSLMRMGSSFGEGMGDVVVVRERGAVVVMARVIDGTGMNTTVSTQSGLWGQSRPETPIKD